VLKEEHRLEQISNSDYIQTRRRLQSQLRKQSRLEAQGHGQQLLWEESE
jgi:hypothetical protein